MKFKAILVNREDQYAVEQEQESGFYYLTMSDLNVKSFVGMDAFYRISDAEFAVFSKDINAAKPLVKKCQEGLEESRRFRDWPKK